MNTKTIKNKAIKFLVIVLAAYGLKQFCESQTNSFTLQRIRSHLSYNPIWDKTLTDLERSELEPILDQKFKYLGHGGQCFVFASEDGRYVIKFFRQHFIGPLLWMRQLPWSVGFKQAHFKKIDRAEKKLFRDFNSFNLAFDELKEESGLIFLHLSKSSSLKKQIIISDNLNIEHLVNLDDYEFAIQKRATPLASHLDQLLAVQNIDGARTALKQVFDLVNLRYRKGIRDEDPRLYNNIGFIGDRAIFIDTGRFKKDMNAEIKDISAFTNKFRLWLKKEYPQLATSDENKNVTPQ